DLWTCLSHSFIYQLVWHTTDHTQLDVIYKILYQFPSDVCSVTFIGANIYGLYACVCVLRIVCIVCEVCARVVCLRLRLSCLNIITISLHPSVFSESESESESEWDLLPSRFTPTWNFFWCEGAYSKHKNIKTQILHIRQVIHI